MNSPTSSHDDTEPRLNEVRSHGCHSQTADAIAERAAELFAAKGFAATSMREIAEAAGVTKPTLYYHFGSKDGLVEHIVRSSMEGYTRDLHEALAQPDLRSSLVHLATQALEFAQSRPATMLLLARLHTQPQGEFGCIDIKQMRREAMTHMTELFRKSGAVRGHDVDMLTLAFHGALHLHQLRRLHAETQLPSPAQTAEKLVNLFLCGASNSPPPTDS